MLSDDPVDEVGLQELSRDDADPDSPAKTLRQSMKIRDHTRMLMETHTARERLRSAGKAQLHRDRNYHRGQAARRRWSVRSKVLSDQTKFKKFKKFNQCNKFNLFFKKGGKKEKHIKLFKLLFFRPSPES